MNKHIRSEILLLIAVLTSGSASAELIFSDVELTVSTRGSGPGVVVPDSKSITIPHLGSGGVEALTLAGGEPFPNEPNTVGSAFASAAHLALGGGVLPGVGVNGFFVRNALHTLAAEASIKQTITNNSQVSQTVLGSFFIPEPTMRFFGVGDFFPGAADPLRDATAVVQARLETKLIGGFLPIEDTLVDYGMQTFREPQTGVFSAKTLDGLELTRAVESDGSFVFRMPELRLENIDLPEILPGNTLEVTYIFTASASTGFGETGFFAAIGDPFNLSTNGGRFEFQVGDVPPPSTVPEPGTLVTLGLGLVVLGISARRRLPTTAEARKGSPPENA